MEALGIDIKFLAAQLINFGLFTFIFLKFMYKPFTAYIANQKKEEDEKERLLKELQVKEESLTEKEKAVLADARAKSAEILKEVEEVASKKRKEIIKKAQKEAITLKQKAQKDIADDKKKMYDELRSKVVHTSESMTENVLKDFLDTKQQKGILKEVFKKLKTSKVYDN